MCVRLGGGGCVAVTSRIMEARGRRPLKSAAANRWLSKVKALQCPSASLNA